jgi:hypothetical protein
MRGNTYHEAYCPQHKEDNMSYMEPNFWCYLNEATEELECYCLNIKIDDVMYGFDSELYPVPQSQIVMISSMDNLITLKGWTAPYENIEYFENMIRRVLNLKAFL